MDRAYYILPIFETVKLSWEKIKGSKATLWGAYGWVLIFGLVSGFILGFLKALNQPGLQQLADILAPLISFIAFILGMGILRIGLLRAQDQAIRATQVFYPIQHGSLILKLVGGWLLYLLIILPFIFITAFALALGFSEAEPAALIGKALAGFIAGFSLILTIYLMVRLRLGWGFILDKELGPWQALKASFRVTRHNFWPLFGLSCVNFFIVAVSVLPLGLGLIWTLPYILINYGQIYRLLNENQG